MPSSLLNDNLGIAIFPVNFVDKAATLKTLGSSAPMGGIGGRPALVCGTKAAETLYNHFHANVRASRKLNINIPKGDNTYDHADLHTEVDPFAAWANYAVFKRARAQAGA